MSGSTIPAVLPALKNTFKAAAATLYVVVGPVYDPPADFLAVGWDRSDQPGVSAVVELADYAQSQDLETYDVSCLLSFSYDSDEVETVLEQLFVVLESLIAALRADHTLGGRVLLAKVVDYDWTPHLTEVGTLADIRFSTRITASK